MSQSANKTRAKTRGTLITVRSVKEASDGVIIEGVANDATVSDSYNTRFRWTDTCIERSRLGIVLFNHNKDLAIGRNIDMDRKNDGSLWVRDRIHPEAISPVGVSYAELARDGILNSISIRMDEDAGLEYGPDYDTITPNYMPEHSIVTLPSNTQSTFTSATRSMVDQLEATPEGQDVMRLWRLGFEPPTVRSAPQEEAVKTKTRDRRTTDPTRAAGPLSLDLLQQRLSKLISASKGDDYWSYTYLVAVYDDYCVWCEYNEGDYYRQGYTVDASGEVTLTGTEQEVLPQWMVVGGSDETDDVLRGLTRDVAEIKTLLTPSPPLSDITQTLRAAFEPQTPKPTDTDLARSLAERAFQS